MIRHPIAPQQFLARAAWLEAGLAALQLMHLSVIALAAPRDFTAWIFVHTIAQITLYVLRRSAAPCRGFTAIPWRPLAVLLLLTFAVKLYSRAPYIASWLSEGLRATRTNEELGEGGSLSFINVFFYPMAILLAFSTMPHIVYRRLIVLVGTICVIDFVFLGTRNAPLFVLLFHLLASHLRFGKRQFVILVGLLIAFVAIFSYSTINRTQESELGTFDWLILFEFTGSSENLKINPAIAQMLANYASALLPAAFLTHYLTHSIAEFAVIVSKMNELILGGGYYLIDQLCAIGMCSRVDSMDAIVGANPRAGIYLTIWGSLLFDFGLLGAGIIWISAILLIFLFQRMHRYTLGPAVAVASVIVMLSPVENFMYNGLGLIQIFILFLAHHLLRFLGRIRLRRIFSNSISQQPII